ALSACALPPPEAILDPAPGISRELAAARAERIADLRYDLRFLLRPGMDEVSGEVTISFVLAAPQPVVIDFDGDALATPQLNGTAVEVERRHNHLLIPSAAT